MESLSLEHPAFGGVDGASLLASGLIPEAGRGVDGEREPVRCRRVSRPSSMANEMANNPVLGQYAPVVAYYA